MDRSEHQANSEPRPPGRAETSALYVQIPKNEAEKLDRAAFELKAHKRDLVAALVARYVDPSTREGLDRLRALGAHGRGPARAEVPQPRPERRAEPREPTVRISQASDWVAGMQRSIREFAQSRRCPKPLVRMTLDDGEQLFLRAMTPGPGDDFVTFTVYEPSDEIARLVVLRLDAVRKIEMLTKPPNAAEKAFVFQPRNTGIGFTSGS
jgi:hypothetical protein